VSRRAEQTAATLQRAIQETIARGFQDPRIRGLITVTGVRMDSDLRTAIVSVSIYPEEAQKMTMHGLNSAARHIRHEVADAVAMRVVPELLFKLDESLKKQAAVLEAIAKAAVTRTESDDQAPDPGTTAEDPKP
jgi:ribosome-binding factor A